MKLIILLTLILYSEAQNGSNASNTTGNGTTNTSNNITTTTTLRGVTTTLGYATTGSPTTTTAPTSPYVETTTAGATTTIAFTTTMNYTTTTQVPICSSETTNSSCRVCLGPLCKFVERGEQGVGWEILFVAFAMGIIGIMFLGIWYVCLKPILHHNSAEDILWITDSSDDEDWQETATMLTNGDIKRKMSREFEIVDLNPVNNKA
tara:strand:- start:690 stop:1307 length:618 start_codon:yes stop_codon:yes gene_type:complete